MKRIVIEGAAWKWQGQGAWYFLPTTKAQGATLRAREKRRVGWGSVRVGVKIGKTAFETSLFPTKDGPYLLPLKASVRKAEGIVEKSHVRATCTFL